MKIDGHGDPSKGSLRSCPKQHTGNESTPDEAMTVNISLHLAKRMLESFWFSQWETCNAAENTVCAFGCQDDPYADFVAHKPDCQFVNEWNELAEVRRIMDDPYEIEIYSQPRYVTLRSSDE